MEGIKKIVMVESMYQLLIGCIYFTLSVFLMLVAYSLLISLYWSLVSCLDRVRDYLNGKGNKS